MTHLRIIADCNHSDAEDPLYVYDWRLGAEKKMRESKGSGMSDEQVNNFVNGCEFLCEYTLF